MALPNLPIKTGHVFIGLAVVMGIMTMFLFGGSHKKTPKHTTTVAKISTTNVVVPLAAISEGKTLSLNDVTTVKWPSDFIPKGKLFADPYQVVGRVAKQDLFPGEPIFIEKLSGSNTNGGLPAIIPNGLRAVTVAVTEIKGVAGFVKPGDHVDVLNTFEVQNSSGEGDKVRAIKTVLQNVMVLATAQTMVEDNKYDIETPEGVTRGEVKPENQPDADAQASDKGDKKSKKKADADAKESKKQADEKKEAEKSAHLVSSVTIALTPAQAQTIALAEDSGDIRLVLRPETDQSIAKIPGMNFEQLSGQMILPKAPKLSVSGRMPSPPAIPRASLGGTQVEFIQGTDKTTYSF
jgi:Flp pilus assembly protein CpaB